MAAMMVAMVMSAHTTEQKFFDNTYVTIKGGVTTLMRPGCNGYENYGHTFEAATSLQAGKWLTPTWGIAIDGTNGWTNGSKFGVFQSDYAVNYVTVSTLAKYRIPFGKFNVVAATGPMWIHGFNKNLPDNNDLGAKMQLEFNYDVNSDWQLNFVPELNYNLTRIAGSQPRFDSRNAWYGLMAGVTYKFNDGFTKCDKVYTQAEWDILNNKVNELRNRKPETVEVEKVVIKTVNTATEYVVFFSKNSTELTNAAIKTLNKVSGNVKVVGGASEDGTLKRNQELSVERANVVADYLKNRGVNVTSVVGAGVTGSRAVVVSND